MAIKNISFSRQRKNISTFFKNKHTLNILRHLMTLTWNWYFLKKKKHLGIDIDIVMGENNIYNKLIVMDNVFSFPDKSNDFANFLTVSRKFNITCVYVFHTIYLTRSKWKIILSKTKVCNIFPGSLQTSSVVKILPSYCNKCTYEYIPHRDKYKNDK